MAIAKKMIECGAMVTIIGRNEAKTKAIADEISSLYLVLDLTDTHELINRVGEYIKDRKIGS